MIDFLIANQFEISIIISVALSSWFIAWQRREYLANKEAILKLKQFFLKERDYSTTNSTFIDAKNAKASNSIIINDVASPESELRNLIADINSYIKKSKGTVAFSIIQNKTERRISMLYEIATSKLSFPTHIGLMGTFLGVFVGLVEFLLGTIFSAGITDSTIQSLIAGVLVSMITSFCGIRWLIKSHRQASEASNQIDRDKNEFYEWVQNELMPSVDVSMVEAIGKLHETIDQFEPTFSRVITEFKNAFKNVTGAFGNEFRESVQIVASAVDTMGQNMNKVNRNIELQESLLSTIKSNQLIKGMDAFVEASKRFEEITGSLDQFERARRIMLVAAQKTINLQKDFNDSLQVPKQIAAEVNAILDRIRTFEQNINGLGENIAHTQMVGSALVQQIKENITAIRSKQKVAETYSDTANKKLEAYFESQKKEVGRIMQKYNEALDAYLNDYETMLKERKEELELRKREFIEVIDQKLSIDEVRDEFSNLKRLNDISQKLEQLMRNPVDGTRLMKVLSGIHTELNAISAIQEDQKKGGFRMGFGNSSNTAVDRAQREREDAVRQADEAKQKAENAVRQAELAKIQVEKERKEKEQLLAKIREEEMRDKTAMEVIQQAQNASSTFGVANDSLTSNSHLETSDDFKNQVDTQGIKTDESTSTHVTEKENQEETIKKPWYKFW